MGITQDKNNPTHCGVKYSYHLTLPVEKTQNKINLMELEMKAEVFSHNAERELIMTT